MRHGSLFSGIGGFDLAAEWMGWENVFHCEWNEFGQKVLNHYWPKAELFKDITKSDFTKYHGSIDIISGGFPCQPYSVAGQRKGKEDERHLWPEMLRAIREVSPRWILGENVLGLTNWNGGLVFDEVQADLESEGYEVLPFLLPAVAVNAPHRRDRIWFVAHAIGSGTGCKSGEACDERRASGKNWGEGIRQTHREACTSGAKSTGIHGNAANAGCIGQTERQKQPVGIEQLCEERPTANTAGIRQPSQEYRQTKSRRAAKTGIPNDWENFPTQSPLCSRNDGISAGLSGITFSKHRNESIKAYGNAVVPQVVYEIFKAIEKYENARTT